MAVRLSLVALMTALTASSAQSAPAPVPKPERPRDYATFNLMKLELRERMVTLLEVIRDGPNAWRFTFLEYRREVLRRRVRRITAPDRLSALSILLEEYRGEDTSPPAEDLILR